jgi:hypothetical protein
MLLLSTALQQVPMWCPRPSDASQLSAYGVCKIKFRRSAEAGHGSGAGILAVRDCWILRRMRRSGRVVCCSNSTNEVNDGPLQEPQYYSYTDPNMGEPSPTFGARTPLADMALWGEDMFHIKRTAQASPPAPSSSTSEQQQQPSTPSAQLCWTITSSQRKLKNVEAHKSREEEINKLEEEEGEELSEAEAEQSSTSLERNGEDE